MADLAERKVLDMVEQGHISAEEGLQLIKAMGKATKSAQESSPDATVTSASETGSDLDDRQPISQKLSEEEMRRIRQLKRWWVLPLGVGIIITTLSAFGMIYGYQAKGFGPGFWLAWLPLGLGIFMIGLSIQTRRGVWLHVRIKQKLGEAPQRIAISLPMPISLIRWFLKIFGRHISVVKDQPLETYSEILQDLSPETPFYVQVNDDDGEAVEVLIG